jgi:hypothetical protein
MRTIGARLRAAAAPVPSRRALVFGDSSYGYSEPNTANINAVEFDTGVCARSPRRGDSADGMRVNP